MRATAGAAGGAAGQALILVWIAKTSTDEILGRYALALAIVAPALLLARMQLRYVLAALPEADWGGLLRARLLATGTAAAALTLTAPLWLPSETAAALAALAFARAFEDLGDLAYGLRQRSGQWTRIAVSQTLRGLGGAAALATGMTLTGGLLGGVLGHLLWQIAVTAGFDARGLRWPPGRWRDAWTPIRACWPLGGSAALVSVIGNLPRYALEMEAGAAAVGHFAALAQIALLGNLPVQAMGVAALGRLGERAAQGRRPFLRLTAALAAASAGVGAAGLVVAVWGGAELLRWLYRPELAVLAPLLPWMMAGAVCTFLTGVLGYALVALGARRTQLAAFGLAALAGAVACRALVPAHGLRGAVWANLLCWLAAAAFSGIALLLRSRSLGLEGSTPRLGADCPGSGSSSKLDGCSAPVRSSCSSAL